MLITDAFAQAGAQTGTAAGGDTMTALLVNLAPFALILVVFYFLLIRPQQQRLKAHQAMILGVKKGDVIVTTGGLIGKVRAVADDELRVELGPNVEVRVLRSSLSEVRNKGEPVPANDTKPSKSEA